jgi:archaellum component FlaF (FlaF/FlaG flagellin family)
MFVDQNNVYGLTNVMGVQSVSASADRSHHSMTIECATAGNFTVKCKETAIATLLSFDGNRVANNSKATFILPGAESFEITPPPLAGSYTVQVHSF